MKSVILAAAALLAAVAGLFVIVKRDSAGAPGAAADSTGAGPSSDELSALRSEVATLKKMAVAQAARPLVAAASAPGRKPPAASKLTPVERRKAITDALETRYGHEAPDPSWSAARAKEIRTAFAGTLPDVKVVSAECLSTMCKVQVEHTDIESQETLMERASDAEALSEETFYVYDRAATPPRTTMYLGRPGHLLPRPQL